MLTTSCTAPLGVFPAFLPCIPDSFGTLCPPPPGTWPEDPRVPQDPFQTHPSVSCACSCSRRTWSDPREQSVLLGALRG